MLDPACGSMHFGLYAFDLYETIYEEAWDRHTELLQDIREKVKDRHEFLSLVPELIIRYNIHGIDIDHRAVQIAGLSLWLRAQKSYQRLGIKPESRPCITRSNIVCAEPMPGEKEYLEEFVSGLKPAVLGDLVRDVWEKMQLAGSLLKIEEELSDSIQKAKEVWEKYKFERGAYIEQDLFEKSKQLSLKEMIGFDVEDIESMEEWDQMEAMLLSALKEFAESALGNGGYNRKLFAEDAAGGFAFIDVCRKRYDVVLMNPPFGEFIRAAKEILKDSYKISIGNLYTAFIERSFGVLKDNAYLGAITERMWALQQTFRKFREKVILKDLIPRIFADLMYGVLDDAFNRTAIFTLNKQTRENEVVLFIDLTQANDKERALREVIIDISSVNKESLHVRTIDQLRKYPSSIFLYSFPDKVNTFFLTSPNVGETLGTTAEGRQSSNDDRYVRTFWEIHQGDLRHNTWISFAKGGENLQFYRDQSFVLRWDEKSQNNYLISGSRKIENSIMNPKIGWSDVSSCLYFQILSKKTVTSPANQGICLFDNTSNFLLALGYLNSITVRAIASNYYDGHHWQPGIVTRIPFPIEVLLSEKEVIANIVRETINIIRILNSGEEENRLFVHPFLDYCKKDIHESLRVKREKANIIETKMSQIDNITNRILHWNREEREFIKEENARFSRVGKAKSVYDYSKKAQAEKIISFIVGLVFLRWDIRISLNPNLAPKLADPFDQLPVCPPGMLVGPDGLPAESGGIVSEEWLRARPNAITLPTEGSVENPTIPDFEYPIEVAWNGILVDDPTHKEDIISRMRKTFQVIWKEKADSIEQEACEILGIKDLRDYFRRPSGFFADHLKRYSKSRRQAPIYWPLSTTSGSYTLLIYYPRLTDQALYRCVNDYINPKLEDTARDIEFKQKETEKNRAMKARQELEDLLNLQQELKEFKSEMLWVAELPYKPDLNDGVLITASPLHKMFRLPKWKKELKKCWESLEKEDYDWAHLAYSIWPDRVREKCRKDRSLAIAHDLEEICEVEPKAVKKKARSNKMEEEQIDLI
ncbi:hypothetical protein ES703_54705 [subsurface metagenome]